MHNNVKGATWDLCDIIDADGNKHDGYLDTSWGHYVYFQEHIKDAPYPASSHWRKVKLDWFSCTENVFDFRKLLPNAPCESLTKSLDILLNE